MKSPIMLISGFSSFAFCCAPPSWAATVACGATAITAGAGAAGAATASAGAAACASRIALRSFCNCATWSASARNCSSSAFTRSSRGAAACVCPLDACAGAGFSCAKPKTGHVTSAAAKAILFLMVKFLFLLLENGATNSWMWFSRGNEGWLVLRRSARRGGPRNRSGRRCTQTRNFQPRDVPRGGRRKTGRRHSPSPPRANRRNVRPRRPGLVIHARMELRREENHPEQQGHAPEVRGGRTHSHDETELRKETLHRQDPTGVPGTNRHPGKHHPMDASPSRRYNAFRSGTSKQVRERPSFEP